MFEKAYFFSPVGISLHIRILYAFRQNYAYICAYFYTYFWIRARLYVFFLF